MIFFFRRVDPGQTAYNVVDLPEPVGPVARMIPWTLAD